MTNRLPLTSIERYHLCDDTVENPNVIGGELTVSGVVDLDIATVALRQVAKRHPMMCGQLAKRKRWLHNESDAGKMTWQVIQVGEDDFGDARTIDLESDLPVRTIMWIDGEQTHLSFRTHHAAMDGGGGLQVVHDWLLTYHRLSCQSKKPKSRQTNPDLLRRRNHLRLLNRQFLGKLWIQPIAVMGATKFIFRKVTSVTDGLADHKGSKPGEFQMLNHAFSNEQTRKLKAHATANKATVNELLLRAVFLAIHDFRKRHQVHQKDEWLRLIIPISIRDFADRRLPGANRATVVQLDRTDKDFADPKGMIWGINYELGNVKSWNLEKTFLLIMRCCATIPGFIKRSSKKKVCRATSVVTNLGAPFDRSKLERINGKIRSGNLIVEDVRLIPPLRKLTPIAFALLRYAGQQKICLHFDPLQISQEHAEEILELAKEQLAKDIDANDASK